MLVSIHDFNFVVTVGVSITVHHLLDNVHWVFAQFLPRERERERERGRRGEREREREREGGRDRNM